MHALIPSNPVEYLDFKKLIKILHSTFYKGSLKYG